MSDIQTNYLINTAPELKQPFIHVLKKIKHFSGLGEEHLNQIFQYSKFIVLSDGERPVQEGTFGQHVYILIQGRLEVFLTNASGVEEYVDVIYTPFRMFGEQCILGEPNNVSVEARGEVLLLGIDISPLPDLLDGLENPENRLEDKVYKQNTDMYIIFADVLNNRLNRLIKDQYKLLQKIVILHQSQEYQISWKQNVLLNTLFNEFSQNQLSSNLNVQEILKSTLEFYISENDRLMVLLSNHPVNTQHVYLELVKLDTMGQLDSMSSLLMEIIQKLSIKALELEEYTGSLELQPHDLPAIIPLSEYLEGLYAAITGADILSKNLSKEEFLEGLLTESHPDPFSLERFLRKGEWVKSEFSMAHLMFLICQRCIEKEFELNQIISGCVRYLINISAPRQNTQLSQPNKQDKSDSVVSEIIALHRTCVGEDEKSVKERPPSSSKQGNVEDLLADFGL
ncbi:cyclic nucleotide-binding domain-containing protein [bacterium]|nr:cyclic nucleotide-binding domain-containing protein [bacterium]